MFSYFYLSLSQPNSDHPTKDTNGDLKLQFSLDFYTVFLVGYPTYPIRTSQPRIFSHITLGFEGHKQLYVDNERAPCKG